jgi:hypothetical protein
MPLGAVEPDDVPQPSTSGSTWISVDAPSDAGLNGLRAHLERVVEQHGLRSLTVVVDDPDLGRQAFRSGAGPGVPGALTAGPGVLAEPAEAATDLDADLLVALCAASLRVDVLRDTADATGELALRRLAGVYAVEIERDDDLTVCRIFVDTDADDDVGRVAARLLTVEPGSRLVIEVERTAPVTIPVAPPLLQRPVDTEPGFDEAARRSPDAGLTLLAVRSVPEEGEIEAHVALGGARAVGRAPLAHGLVGAAEAVLAATTQVEPGSSWQSAWVRTVETTADGHFVVAVALVDPGADGHRHGIATGLSPIEAAARATANALP